MNSIISISPLYQIPREAYRDEMASVWNFIVCTSYMACEKQNPTCSGAFWSKWENHSTYSRAKPLKATSFKGSLSALVTEIREIPKGERLGSALLPLPRGKGSAARHERKKNKQLKFINPW